MANSKSTKKKDVRDINYKFTLKQKELTVF